MFILEVGRGPGRLTGHVDGAWGLDGVSAVARAVLRGDGAAGERHGGPAGAAAHRVRGEPNEHGQPAPDSLSVLPSPAPLCFVWNSSTLTFFLKLGSEPHPQGAILTV